MTLNYPRPFLPNGTAFALFFMFFVARGNVSIVWPAGSYPWPSVAVRCDPSLIISRASPIQAEALAIHFQSLNVEGEPVQQRTGQPPRAQYHGPLLEWQVAGHHRLHLARTTVFA